MGSARVGSHTYVRTQEPAESSAETEVLALFSNIRAVHCVSHILSYFTVPKLVWS
jgi:hypothetical protein